MRSPSGFSDVSVKPSFLRTTVAKKPRIECCCQPVVFMMAAIVTPVGCSRRASTDSCFVLPRAEAEATFLAFTGLFALLVPARFVLFDVLRCDILDPFGVATASGAATTAAPQWRYHQWGRIRDGQGINVTTLTLCLQQKSSPFCDGHVTN